MSKAIATAPENPFVHQAVLNFVVFAFTKKNYELCDRVLLPALSAHPDDEDLRSRARTELKLYKVTEINIKRPIEITLTPEREPTKEAAKRSSGLR